MDKVEFDKIVADAKKRLLVNEKLVIREPVVNDLGEVVYGGKISVIKEVFPNIPYRTPRDLKGYDDTTVNTEPSLLDLTNYVDNRVMISRLMQSFSENVLNQIAEDHDKDSVDMSNVGDDYSEFDETDEPLDNLTFLANKAQNDLFAMAQNMQLQQEQADEGAKERSDDKPEEAS